MKTRKLNAPWKKFYSKEQLEFEIPNISMYQMLRERAYEIKNSKSDFSERGGSYGKDRIR